MPSPLTFVDLILLIIIKSVLLQRQTDGFNDNLVFRGSVDRFLPEDSAARV